MGLLLQQLPNTRVLIVGILPRGTGSGKGARLGQNDMRWPSHYTQGIANINALLKCAELASCQCLLCLLCGNAVDVQAQAAQTRAAASRHARCRDSHRPYAASASLRQATRDLPPPAGPTRTKRLVWSLSTAGQCSSRATRSMPS